MSLRIVTSAIAALAAVAVTTPAAHAYFADGDGFAAQAGSVAVLTGRDSLMEPTALAIRSALAVPLQRPDAQQKREASVLSEFYAARDYNPNWILDGKLGDPALALVAVLGTAEEDGLDPADYPAPTGEFGNVGIPAPEDIAAADLTLSRSILRYARHAQAGRVDPRSISKNITITPEVPDPAAVLTDIIEADAPGEALRAYNPQHDGYVRLREQLAELRTESDAEEQVVVPAGPSLKPGMTDARVALLRERLDVTQPTDNPELFDEALVAAVQAFQGEAGLTVDGIVGPRTLAELNGTDVDYVGEVIANMERWRWLPRDLGRFYVHVNVPSFSLDVYRDGAHVHNTRVVVGKVSNQTPIFSDEMEHLIVNPYWNVPASITRNEMLPSILSNPGSLASGNYEVLASDGVRWRVVNPYQVNWFNLDTSRVRIRQRPGAGNALGAIKFMFPNQHSVYLHDTPAKSLFERDVRAYSHGCIRVLNPFDFAEVILSEEPEWNVDRVKSLVGGSQQQVNLASHIPVHITYFTAWVDGDGLFHTRRDLYGHSARVRAALGV